MKRDMGLVREILIYIEKQPPGKTITQIEIESSCSDLPTVIEHLSIMIEAGLLDGEVFGDDTQGWRFMIQKITWEGHDFLNAVKNDNVWKKLLIIIKEHATDLTLDIIKELGKLYLKQELGIL